MNNNKSLMKNQFLAPQKRSWFCFKLFFYLFRKRDASERSELSKDALLAEVKFLQNILYKHSINKYCIADILRPYNKSKLDLERMTGIQTFMKNHKEYIVKSVLTPKHEKEHIFADYKAISSALNWIDFSFGFEFQNDLIATEG